MRNLVLTALAATMLSALALTGGCVSKKEYDEALAAVRRANAQREQCEEALRESRLTNQRLKEQYSDVNAVIESKNEEIALLEQARADLQRRFDELKALYDQRIAEAPPELGPLPPLPEAVDRRLKEFAREHPDLLDYLPEYGMVKFKSDLTFPPGSDRVNPDAQDALREFVRIVQGPEAERFNIYVAGHTDDMPISRPSTKQRHPDNWYLSVHRATAVQQVLQAAGLDPERIGVLGFSKYHPVEPNKPNNKGNQANRRVEVWIVSPDMFLTQATTATPTK